MKNRIFYVFVSLILLSIEAKTQVITSQEAENVVLELYSDTIYDEYQIYQRIDIAHEDDLIMNLYDTVAIVEEESYVFFVDESPFNNWGHSCKYILVSTSDASVTTHSRTMPPNLGEYEVVKKTSIVPPSGFIVPDFSKFATSSKRCDNNESQYAVIINGGISKYQNYQRYWRDCSFIYKTLVDTYGYEKSNIYVLMSDGQNPAVDMCVPDNDGNCSFLSSPLDLDGDGVADIQYSATKANISLVFDSLAAKMTADDNLFIFTMDHGGYDENTHQSFLCLWNNEKLMASDFGIEVNKINQNAVINTVMGQCNAGGFANVLNNGVNRVSSFASTYDKPSWSLDNGEYDAFVFYFTSAINGFTPRGDRVNADIDGNGEISMYEAFNFARMFSWRDTPIQEQSNAWLPSVLTMCNKDKFDLVIADSPTDKGSEPNYDSDYMYVSEDIYIRLQQDGFTESEHQNPISGETAYVYVKVQNNSYKSYFNDEEEGGISLFWAKAGLNLSWPQPWLGNDSIDGIALGGLIGIKPVIDPDIPYYKGYSSGLDRTYCFEWQVPNLDDYEDLPENWHFCLLAVLNSEADTITDNNCIGNLDGFVRNNNNIAWKNISIINQENNNSPTYVSINNWSEDKLIVNLLFSNAKNETSPLLHEVADIIITPNKPLYELFLDNWSSAYGMDVCMDRDYSFVIGKDSANINLVLSPDELYLLGLDIDFIVGRDTDKELYKYDISLRDTSRNHTVIGGEQYLIEKWEPDWGIVVNAGNNQSIHLGDYATLNAANAGSDVTYKWIDKKNDTVINAQIVEVSPIETQNYILKVETENGYVGYDSTTVVVKTDFIESITPLPAQSTTTITYEASRANSASLEIMNSVGVVVANYPVDPSLNQYLLDCSSLSAGQYTIMLNCNGKRKDAKILIVE